MSTDNLDTLRDAELSEVFAVEYAGWREIHPCSCGVQKRGTSPEGKCIHVPPFATSADAVLPFLNKWRWMAGNGQPLASIRDNDGLMVKMVKICEPDLGLPHAVAPTFARAACIALIRSRRAEK